MKSPSSVRMAVAAVLAAAGIPTLSHADSDYSWNNPAGGNWSTDGNWSIPSYPGSSSGDLATIDLAGTYTVSLDTDINIAGLTLNNSDLTLDTGSTYLLKVSVGAVNFQAGAITGNGIFIDNYSRLNLGANSGAGTFTTHNLVYLDGDISASQTVNAVGYSNLQSSRFNNSGTLRLDSNSE